MGNELQKRQRPIVERSVIILVPAPAQQKPARSSSLLTIFVIALVLIAVITMALMGVAAAGLFHSIRTGFFLVLAS